MAVTQYIGARYVPVFADPAEWTSTKQYEPLTIVLHQGNSFTSKQFVPVGIDINDTDYWSETGNYNAQVEQYRQEVLDFTDYFNEKPFSFDTVADMKNSTKLYDGAICHTNGYYTAGDGGEGWYKIIVNATANEMDIITCNNYFAKLIVDSQTINVKSLGAVGDGINDDYNYIVRCIALLYEKYPLVNVAGGDPRGGGVVYFPSGIYKVTQALTETVLHANISLIGDSKNVSIIKPVNTYFINVNSLQQPSGYTDFATSNLTIANLSFINAQKTVISILGAYKTVIHDCKFMNINDSGNAYAVLFYLCVGCIIRQCVFNNCDTAISVSGAAGVGPSTTLLIDSCWISHCISGFSCSFTRNALHTSAIRNCIIEYNNYGIYFAGNYDTYRSDILIDGIHFEGNSVKDILISRASATIVNANTVRDYNVRIINPADPENKTITYIKVPTVQYSKYDINNMRENNSLIIEGEDGTLLDLVSKKIVVHSHVFILDSNFIQTSGTVVLKYKSSDKAAMAVGTFVRGTGFTLTSIYGDTFITNSGGTVSINDSNGTDKTLEIEW